MGWWSAFGCGCCEAGGGDGVREGEEGHIIQATPEIFYDLLYSYQTGHSFPPVAPPTIMRDSVSWAALAYVSSFRCTICHNAANIFLEEAHKSSPMMRLTNLHTPLCIFCHKQYRLVKLR